MVEFGTIFSKLKPEENDLFEDQLELLLIPGEEMLYTFKGLGDGVVFTNKRIFTVQLPNKAGEKKDYTSIPYSSITSYSVECEKDVSIDPQLTVISKDGRLGFAFSGYIDLPIITKLIGQRIL